MKIKQLLCLHNYKLQRTGQIYKVYDDEKAAIHIGYFREYSCEKCLKETKKLGSTGEIIL